MWLNNCDAYLKDGRIFIVAVCVATCFFMIDFDEGTHLKMRTPEAAGKLQDALILNNLTPSDGYPFFVIKSGSFLVQLYKGGQDTEIIFEQGVSDNLGSIQNYLSALIEIKADSKNTLNLEEGNETIFATFSVREVFKNQIEIVKYHKLNGVDSWTLPSPGNIKPQSLT